MTCAWPNCRHVKPRCAARSNGPCTTFDGENLTASRKAPRKITWAGALLIASLALALGVLIVGQLQAAERTYQMEQV